MDRPETRYAKTDDDVHIAYQVVGDGPPDFLYMSPWVSHIEHRWERVVMDEVGSERAVIYGASGSGAMACLFAATYPERTTALVIHGSYPSGIWEPDAPWGYTDERFEEQIQRIERGWPFEDAGEHDLRGVPDRWQLYRVVG